MGRSRHRLERLRDARRRRRAYQLPAPLVIAAAFDGSGPVPLKLEIVSPERRAYSDEVDMVTVPGIDGELGILPHHTRLISALGTGELRIKKAGTEQILLISGGFVEVRADRVIVMADLAEHSDEIDETKAVEARKRAEAELGEVHDPIDIARVRASLQTALMRERIATRRRSRG
jgi:F-type H+-transporting ATPase subunit epsilon